MTDRIHMSRVALALGAALALTACTSMNKPLSKSYGVANQANMQAQIVPIDPATVDHGPTPTSAGRVGVAREAYDSGNVKTDEAPRTGGGR